MSPRTKISGLLALLAVTGVIVMAFNYYRSTANAPIPPTVAGTNPAKNTQTIELTANFGYTPGLIQARAGQPALLKVKTKDTTDCSVEFRIPALGIVATLPPTGETIFEIPAQPPGSSLQGACQMGMSHFEIDFN